MHSVSKKLLPRWFDSIVITNAAHAGSCMIVLKKGRTVNFHFPISRQNVSYVLRDIDEKLSGIILVMAGWVSYRDLLKGTGGDTAMNGLTLSALLFWHRKRGY
jgi:hypothetical protein